MCGSFGHRSKLTVIFIFISGVNGTEIHSEHGIHCAETLHRIETYGTAAGMLYFKILFPYSCAFDDLLPIIQSRASFFSSWFFSVCGGTSAYTVSSFTERAASIISSLVTSSFSFIASSGDFISSL